MCMLLTLMFLGPRAGLVVYWIGWNARWEAAFDTWIVPLVGFIFFPWATMMYVFVAPGGVSGLDFALVVFGGLLDVFSLVGGGGYSRSRRQVQYG
jgi:hypothetical protein